MGELFFRGRWVEVIGTEMIVGQDEQGGHKIFAIILTIEANVIGITRKRLMLEQIILKRKDGT